MARRKKSGAATVDPNAWMVTFGDLVTLLLTFFVLLLTMSSMDSQKTAEISHAASGTIFAAIDSASSTSPEEATPLDVDLLEDVIRLISYTLYSADRELVSNEEYLMSMSELFEKGEDSEEFQALLAGSRLGEPGGDPDAPPQMFLTAAGQGVRISLPSDFTFAPRTATPSPAIDPMLKKLGRLIKRYSLEAEVSGHTDNTPIHSVLYSSNWELSCARSASVLRRMKDLSNLNPLYLAAACYADRQPVADNRTPVGRAKNRRVDIFLKLSEKSRLGEYTDTKIDPDPLRPADDEDLIHANPKTGLMGQ